jgi:hypothetical protein
VSSRETGGDALAFTSLTAHSVPKRRISHDSYLGFEFHQERGERFAERLDARLLLGVDE